MDLTQPRLAEKLGVSNGAVGNWESDKFKPSREMLRKISELLGTTENFLSGESDIEVGAFIEQTTEYNAALPFSRMTGHELDFIYGSRQKELNETTDPKKRRELLRLIADLANEMEKRIPHETAPDVEGRSIKPEEKKK